jgi:hypothetical protein
MRLEASEYILKLFLNGCSQYGLLLGHVQLVSAKSGSGTISIGICRHKLYRHNMYRHKLHWHNLYRHKPVSAQFLSAQFVSGNNCIGKKLPICPFYNYAATIRNGIFTILRRPGIDPDRSRLESIPVRIFKPRLPIADFGFLKKLELQQFLHEAAWN